MLDIMTIPVTAFDQNCRLLVNQETGKCIACDVGGSAKEIYNLIKTNDFKLQAIVLTHGHLDHAGGAKALSELASCPVIGPCVEDRFLFETLDKQAIAFSLPHCEPFEPSYVKDGDILNFFDDASLEVIHTPGHTPGGICLYCKEENFVLSGDTLFEESIGRTDFPQGSFDSLIASIKNRLFILPDYTEVLSGHGDDTTIGNEKRNNPFII